MREINCKRVSEDDTIVKKQYLTNARNSKEFVKYELRRVSNSKI